MTILSEREKENVEKYFEIPFTALTIEVFKQKLKELRSKYHPDKFEKFADETVKEMATERFQMIQALAEKLESYFAGKPITASDSKGNDEKVFMNPYAVFAANKFKIEILTSNKDLKYRLFGSSYRWLTFGDSFKIPETKAHLIIDEDHRGRRIGYQESIRMYLTFDEETAIESIIEWLYPHLKDQDCSIIIDDEKTAVELSEILYTIRKKAFVRVRLPEGRA
jgi:hypothetical protein